MPPLYLYEMSCISQPGNLLRIYIKTVFKNLLLLPRYINFKLTKNFLHNIFTCCELTDHILQVKRIQLLN